MMPASPTHDADAHNRAPATLLFVVIRPPPTSTLFPYTTLFRSRTRRQTRQTRGDCRQLVGTFGGDVLAGRHQEPVSRNEKDRKSTRLNSSHSSISYAVFCLKKKSAPRTRFKHSQIRVHRPCCRG